VRATSNLIKEATQAAGLGRRASRCSHLALRLAGDGQEELELGRQLVFGVEPIREVDSSDAAVGVDLNSETGGMGETSISNGAFQALSDLPEGLNVVGAVGSSGEVGQVELNLVPALIESHWHRADEGFDARRRLVVGGAESSAHVLVIQNLHLEREVLL